MKSATTVIIVGLVIFFAGYFINEMTKESSNKDHSSMSVDEFRKTREKQKSVIRDTGYMKTIGIVISVCGGLWLIVSAIREKGNPVRDKLEKEEYGKSEFNIDEYDNNEIDKNEIEKDERT